MPPADGICSRRSATVRHLCACVCPHLCCTLNLCRCHADRSLYPIRSGRLMGSDCTPPSGQGDVHCADGVAVVSLTCLHRCVSDCLINELVPAPSPPLPCTMQRRWAGRRGTSMQAALTKRRFWAPLMRWQPWQTPDMSTYSALRH